MRRRSRLAALAAALVMLLAACGGDTATTTTTGDTGTTGAGGDFAVMPEMTDMSLILDFVPGGIHAGIYSAAAEGYFEEANLNVDIQPPTSSADTLRLVLAGQATVGIAPVADVAALRAQGEPVKIFLALEQVPLGALMSTEAIGISDPSELADGTIGVTGVPSDEAIARFILESSGVDPSGVEFITIGFDAVANLIGQTVDAAIGFWSAEAVVLELEGETPVVFRADEYGAPPYPELVLFSSETTVENQGLLLEAFADALARGYQFALDNQAEAIANLAANADGIDTEFASAEFDNVRPYFLGSDGRFGSLDPEAFSEYLAWAAEVGILESVPEGLLTTGFMP